MKIKMTLLSDTIFGNGESIPGGEDISVLYDENGFPFFKGGTFKGIFREELSRLLKWKGKEEEEINRIIKKLLGVSDNDEESTEERIQFSDFQLSGYVKEQVQREINNPAQILDSLTHLRTFTQIEENGIVKEGSLRTGRCINKGLVFYSEIQCKEDQSDLICNTLAQIKWIGTMRNRGFGKVLIEPEEGGAK